MAEYRLNGVLWAVSLVIAGLLLLVFNLELAGLDQPQVRLILAAGLALAGLVFLSAFLVARQHWWRLIPAWTLLALAGMVFLNTLAPANSNGALLLVGLAVAFAHIYLLDRILHWWAILPGGFLLVLAITVAVYEQTPPALLGGLLFAGTGLVFALVYLLGDRQRQWWALAPGATLVLFGLFILARENTGGAGLLRWWPLLLIGMGVLVGWRTVRRSPPERLMVNATSATLAGRQRVTAQPARSVVTPAVTTPTALGEYSQPAPGTTVDILSDE